MMIGDDDVDSQRGGPSHYFACSNPGVDADNQRNPLGGSALDHLGAHAISFLEAIRDMKHGAAAGQLDSLLQHYDRRRSVDVVVAVDQNFFPSGDRASYPPDSLRHAKHSKGIVQVSERR